MYEITILFFALLEYHLCYNLQINYNVKLIKICPYIMNYD